MKIGQIAHLIFNSLNQQKINNFRKHKKPLPFALKRREHNQKVFYTIARTALFSTTTQVPFRLQYPLSFFTTNVLLPLIGNRTLISSRLTKESWSYYVIIPFHVNVETLWASNLSSLKPSDTLRPMPLPHNRQLNHGDRLPNEWPHGVYSLVPKALSRYL